jgi:hypothetical protein
MNIPRIYDLAGPGPCWDIYKGSGQVDFRCPNGHIGVLDDHTIADDGAVSPSVVCPRKGCAFHENIILDGWKQNVIWYLMVHYGNAR